MHGKEESPVNMEPTTLSAEYVSQLGLTGAAAGDKKTLTFDIQAVNPDGSMTVAIEPEGGGEDDGDESGEGAMPEKMAPAMAIVLGKSKAK